MSEYRALGLESKAWPFVEARRILARLRGETPEKGYVLFETGYGPSGLPHIGTFGEVARTAMVRYAFSILSDVPTKLVCFSDDMDGLRKVPDNIPEPERLEPHLGKPLTAVPDPFGTHESFGEHNNARLRAFLDQFGFDYEFVSSTGCYRSGRFDSALGAVLERYEKIREIVLPTLGEERRKTYSPFLPLDPTTGVVLQVPILETDPAAGTITFEDSTGERRTVPVTGGNVKCQWKVDWAMRWFALAVDYEMSGKDLIESVNLSSRICRALGARPPEGFNYELFLDENGEKISKSRGNGITIEQWLAYGTPESLSLFMYRSPRKAKRLHFDVIPRTVDEYYDFLARFPEQEPTERLGNPAFHIHRGDPPRVEVPVGFAQLLNLAAAAHVREKAALWDFVARYSPGASPETAPEMDRLLGYALEYYADFVQPGQRRREPTTTEAAAMKDLAERLRALGPDAGAQEIQSEVYEVGKEHGFDPLSSWFKALYECLLGQPKGPRMGSFVAIYGIANTIELIESSISR